MLDHLILQLKVLWDEPQERKLLERTILALDMRYGLEKKMIKEPGVEEIIIQMVARLARSIGRLSDLPGKKVLDIACGSNTSRAPRVVHVKSPLGKKTLGSHMDGHTALFEPWFCRILLELGADPIGLDLGDLENEAFTHYSIDLGKSGALDFLPDGSFDAIQDSRLFGSPEFTEQFPKPADRLQIAREIRRQERRLLRDGGILIHSDARELVG